MGLEVELLWTLCAFCVSLKPTWPKRTSPEVHNHFPQRVWKSGLSLKRKQIELLCALQRLRLSILCELFI